MDGEPGLVRFENVALTFPGASGRSPVEVLRRLDLDITAGEFVAIIGPSGCGKSTLLSMLAGYLAPSSGRVLFQDQPIAGPGRERMMVFQQPALFPWLTAAENVAYGLKLKANRGNRPVRDTVADLLRLVQLDGFARHYPSDLSGGMRQRLEIARALAVNPQVLLMDEPLAALDALTRRTMQREVLRIWEQTQKTIVFVTHDIDEAVIMADRIFVMAQRPSFVLEVEEVGLSRPRERDDPEFAPLDAASFGVARMRRSRWLLRLVSPICLLLAWEAASRFGWLNKLLFPPPSRDCRPGSTDRQRLSRQVALCEPVPRRLRLRDRGYRRRRARRGDGADPAGQRTARPAGRAYPPDLTFGALSAGDLMARHRQRVENIIIALAASFPVILNTFAGVRGIDANLFRASRSLGASELELFKGIVLPGSLPHIFTGVRLAWGSP